MVEVARQRLSDQVAQHLREMIIEGEISAGQALPSERKLAEQFDVSSVVIREALKTLSVNGLVEIRHGAGSFVTTPDQWRVAEPIATLIRSGHAKLLHVVETRAVLEIEISGLAAMRHTETDLQTLDATLERMVATQHDPVAHSAADMGFHRALAASADNPVMALVLQPLLGPIQTIMLRGTRIASAMSRAVEEHRRIRDAVAAHDPEAARAAMSLHMQTSRDEVTALQQALSKDKH
ncbi:FadR/GntR family transcriptional regulator [Dictyobacter formicarum]|uniref:Transcriptional regulator n=1 Tax=Dictyobacter formicarum TaxID=2778368 RepID=A0ABQ3VVW0_9CHLR|nr:FadR/GntR family transcriptional regulator [Dictyobacter formicarum]GHO89809.1 transcriptional regulator [Dictyobacter formicarum]